MQSAAAASLRQNDSLGRKDQRQKRGNESESDHHGIARRDTQLERDSKRFEDDPAPICFQKDRRDVNGTLQEAARARLLGRLRFVDNTTLRR